MTHSSIKKIEEKNIITKRLLMKMRENLDDSYNKIWKYMEIYEQ